jgi:hypothetical protein
MTIFSFVTDNMRREGSRPNITKLPELLRLDIAVREYRIEC